jgi:hypothetical protein
MRPELRDSDISRQLERRAAGEWQPERVLTAVRPAMDQPRTERVATPRWAALAALAGLLGVVILLAVALPRLDLSPAAPSPTPAGGVIVLSTEEFATRLVTGELNGSTVLVEGWVDPVARDPLLPKEAPPCGPSDDDECLDTLGMLVDAEDLRVFKRWFAVPEAEASMRGGQRDGWQWWDSPEAPVEGTLLLSVDDDGRVIYEGRARRTSAGLITTAADAARLDSTQLRLDEVLLVDSWLGGRAEPVTCTAAEEMRGLPSRQCSGGESWLSAEEDPTTDRVRVQYGAYEQFSRGPNDGDLDRGSRRGIYAVARRLIGGGCPENQPPCWDWMIVARLAGSASQPVITPVPPVTPAPDTPPPAAPPGSLTCRPYVMGGTDPSPGPVYPSLDIQLSDQTHTVVDCAYFSEFATLPEGQVIQPRWNDVDELGLTWNVAHICPSSAQVELRRDAERFIVTVEQGEIEDCGAAPGRQAVIIWFDGPSERAVDASMVGGDPVPPVQPTPAAPAVRIECDEIFAPAWNGARRGEAVIVDHSGVVDGSCQWFRAVPSEVDGVAVVNPTGSPALLEISWPVPMVCDYMPVELAVWRTDGGVLVHIDRKGVIFPDQSCRDVMGRQGVALNLSEPIMASSVDTVLTTEGAATTTVDMPAAGMTWTLSLMPGKTEYAAGESIDVAAILAYDGELGTRTLVGSGSGLVGFSIGQLDGDLSMGGLMTSDCRPYEITSGEPLTLPYAKGAGWSADDPNAAFYEEWVRDPEFTLPAGAWRIRASANFALGECGGRMVSLDTSIVITVR